MYSTIAKNELTHGSSEGGGVYNGVSASISLTIINTTIAENRAGIGGGLRNGGGSVWLRNTIIANNDGANCIGGTSNINTIIESNSTCGGINVDPLLAPLGDYGGTTLSYAPLPGSPAIDAGDSSYCSASPVSGPDQRGVARSVSSSCDIGAFESRGFTMAKAGGDLQNTTLNASFSEPLAVTITANVAGEPVGEYGSVTLSGPASGASLSASVNGSSDSNGTLATNTKNLIEDNSCSPALSGDPLLSSLGDYGGSTQTFGLLPGSKAIDAGDATTCSASPVSGLDQRGVARSVGSSCDIGSFESRGFTLSITGGNNQVAAINSDFASPLALQLSAIAPDEPMGPGGLIKLSAPSSGPGLTTPGISASTSAMGTISVDVSTNGIMGSYTVTATASGVSTPASFTLTNAGLQVSTSGAGSVTSTPAGIDCGGSCVASFSAGQVITLTATAGATSKFAGWSGACTGSGSCVVTMDQARSGSASFQRYQVWLPLLRKS